MNKQASEMRKLMKVRVQFSKHGVTKYIGHLDMMRYFQKALRRADIPIKYSGGFSPHQILSFAQPLGVGVESEGEYFDMELEHEDNLSEMMDRLNQAMTDGVVIKSMVELPDNAMNAMASIAAASYEVRFFEGKAPDFDLTSQIEALMKMEEIPYLKQTKKNEIEIDLKKGIFELYDKDQVVYMTVDASSSGNIKPATVMEVIYRMAGKEVPGFALAITRMETYTKDAKQNLIPLSAVRISNE